MYNKTDKNYRSVIFYQCFIFVHFGLDAIALISYKAKMDEEGVLVNYYIKLA